jgi:hypothetical protein
MPAVRIVSFVVAVGVLAYVVSAHADATPSREVLRIQSHFDSVLKELAARNLDGMTPLQRARRAALVATLRGYRDRGAFPHNWDYPGELVPYFVDTKTGTLCAFGYLLESTGRRDIVDRVSAADNHVRALELEGDTALKSWLEANGLTLAEAARIQPSYGFEPVPPNQQRKRETPLGYVASMGIALTTSLINGADNVNGDSRLGTTLGLVSGVFAMSLGVYGLWDDDVTRRISVANIAAGAMSTLFAQRSALRHERIVARQRDAERRVTVTPTLSSSSGPGLAVSLRF